MDNLKITYYSPSMLIENPHNVRVHPLDQIRKLKRSIKEFGFLNPILIDKDYIVLCGHARLKAALDLNLKAIPTICSSHLTPKQCRQFMLIDNRINELSEWNLEKFQIEMKEFSFQKDLEYFGFDYKDFNLDHKPFNTNESENEEDSSSSDSDNANFLKAKIEIQDKEFLLLIECESEQHQKEIYKQLISSAYKVKII